MSDLRWLDDAEDPARIALRQGLDESERFTHSELRQRRVWARVSEPGRTVRATRNAFVRGALVASALTASAVVVVQRFEVPAGTGSGVASVAASRDAAAAPEATASPTLAVVAPAGSVVETGVGERLVRILPRGARAELAPRTSVAVDEQGRPELRRGEVRFPSRQPNAAARASAEVLRARRLLSRRRRGRALRRQGRGAVDQHRRRGRRGRDLERLARRAHRLGRDVVERRAAPRARTGAPRAARDKTPALAPAATASTAQASPSRTARISRRPAPRARPPIRAAPSRSTSTSPRAAARRPRTPSTRSAASTTTSSSSPRKAVAAWDRYRTRYPNGLLRAEADLSVIDTLATLGTLGRRHAHAQRGARLPQALPAQRAARRGLARRGRPLPRARQLPRGPRLLPRRADRESGHGRRRRRRRGLRTGRVPLRACATTAPTRRSAPTSRSARTDATRATPASWRRHRRQGSAVKVKWLARARRDMLGGWRAGCEGLF